MKKKIDRLSLKRSILRLKSAEREYDAESCPILARSGKCDDPYVEYCCQNECFLKSLKKEDARKRNL